MTMTPLEAMLSEALRLGIEMRSAQARYFKAPRDSDEKREALRQSKTLERRFDSLAPQTLRHVETRR